MPWFWFSHLAIFLGTNHYYSCAPVRWSIYAATFAGKEARRLRGHRAPKGTASRTASLRERLSEPVNGRDSTLGGHLFARHDDDLATIL